MPCGAARHEVTRCLKTFLGGVNSESDFALARRRDVCARSMKLARALYSPPAMTAPPSSEGRNGLAISSIPSRPDTTMTEVPRHTKRPKVRV